MPTNQEKHEHGKKRNVEKMTPFGIKWSYCVLSVMYK